MQHSLVLAALVLQAVRLHCIPVWSASTSAPVWSEFGGHNVGGIKSGLVSQSLTVQLFPWLGELGTVLLEHEKFCARNMSNVR